MALQSDRRVPRQRALPVKVADLPMANQTFEVRATQKYHDVVDNIREGAALLGLDMSEFSRQAVRAAYDRVKANQPIDGDIDWSMIGTDSFRAPLLSRVPCGPWNQAIMTDQSFVINREVADELEAQADDVFVRAEGASMEGAGIQDDYLVLARPYKNRAPKRGDIVLIQVFTGSENDDGVAEEAALGTIKRFNGMSGNIPKLLDGNDEEYELPEGTIKADIIARAIGVIGRL